MYDLHAAHTIARWENQQSSSHEAEARDDLNLTALTSQVGRRRGSRGRSTATSITLDAARKGFAQLLGQRARVAH
ncbi:MULTISPECIES: hypothetical protein [Aestuariimicrobium]|uniref:hypothetical protein n=1 Tax=Aestuariimicrobium TaxID=396388 RepID=UPI0003B549B9|nr:MULTISPECIES: hypothetical protein [Aestuariimicrobium]CAI9403217.1 hypothetical protein AESSP_00960 [Aestuariimicrobium sp. T2.26MG-19.2B]